LTTSKSVRQLFGGEIKRLREEGYSLQQIGEMVGVTRERVRQILNKYYPGTKPKLLSTRQVAERSGVPESVIRKLRRSGLIHPARMARNSNSYRYEEKTLQEVKIALSRPCRICSNPILLGNMTLCAKCSTMMRDPKLRLSLPGERERHKIAMRLWRKRHPEKARVAARKSTAKYCAEMSRKNYEISVYEVRLPYPDFKVGERFKAIGFRNHRLLLADGRSIPTMLVTKVLGPRRPFSKKKLESWDKM